MLKKLKMPKPKSMDTSELDYMEESPEEEAAESPEMEAVEGPEGEKEEKHSSVLASASDEDLLAEVKKRGLMAQMEKETGEESSEDAYI